MVHERAQLGLGSVAWQHKADSLRIVVQQHAVPDLKVLVMSLDELLVEESAKRVNTPSRLRIVAEFAEASRRGNYFESRNAGYASSRSAPLPVLGYATAAAKAAKRSAGSANSSFQVTAIGSSD